MESASGESVQDWSPDGHWLAVATQGGLAMLSLDTLKTQPYSEGGGHARFSPDGKWVAYQRRQLERPEVFIQPFPATSARWQISTAGGSEPQWRGDGKELFYASSDNPAKIMAVDIAVNHGAIQPGIPHPVLGVNLEAPHGRWTVTRDGRKFLTIIVQTRKPAMASQSIIYNWPALLEKR